MNITSTPVTKSKSWKKCQNVWNFWLKNWIEIFLVTSIFPLGVLAAKDSYFFQWKCSRSFEQKQVCLEESYRMSDRADCSVSSETNCQWVNGYWLCSLHSKECLSMLTDQSCDQKGYTRRFLFFFPLANNLLSSDPQVPYVRRACKKDAPGESIAQKDRGDFLVYQNPMQIDCDRTLNFYNSKDNFVNACRREIKRAFSQNPKCFIQDIRCDFNCKVYSHNCLISRKYRECPEGMKKTEVQSGIFRTKKLKICHIDWPVIKKTPKKKKAPAAKPLLKL